MARDSQKRPLNRPALGLLIVAAIILLIALLRYGGSVPWSAR